MTKQQTKNELELIKEIKENNCSDSLTILTERHSALFSTIYRRFAKILNSRGINPEELLKNKITVFYDAARKFKEEKGVKFTTWLGQYVRYHCLNLLNNTNKDYLTESIESHVNIHLPPENHDKDILFNVIENLPDPKLKQIFSLRYYSNGRRRKPWKQVSAEMGVSVQWLMKLHKKGLPLLKKKLEENLG